MLLRRLAFGLDTENIFVPGSLWSLLYGGLLTFLCVVDGATGSSKLEFKISFEFTGNDDDDNTVLRGNMVYGIAFLFTSFSGLLWASKEDTQ